MHRRRWLRPGLAALIVLVWLLAGHGRTETERYDPHSRIQRPFGQGAAYFTAAAALGQLREAEGVQSGYCLAAVLRPHRAADFYDALYAWNTALVLQVDKQGDQTASILSGDLVLRRYLGDMRPAGAGRAVFLGLGAGISHVAWAARDGAAGGSADAFAFLAEAGLEWNLNPALVLLGKGQYRLYDRGGHDHSGWSVHVGAGVPLPF